MWSVSPVIYGGYLRLSRGLCLASDDDGGSTRKRRADGERNRALLLATAKSAFAEKGSGASLDEIARTARVGVGTLYRHFPTRDALIEAVYLNESKQLLEAAEALAASHGPAEALRKWLLLFVDYVATKRLMAEAISSLSRGPGAVQASSNALVTAALDLLVGGAVAAGKIHLKVEPFSILLALAAVANTGALDSLDEAKRLVEVLIAGLHTSKPSGAHTRGT
jgi:AcrR family transcriptional regulator